MNNNNNHSDDNKTYEEYLKQITFEKEQALKQWVDDNTTDSKTKIVMSLETEFAFLEKTQMNIIQSNKEMCEWASREKDPETEEVIKESIEVNRKYFIQNRERMKEIKEQIMIWAGYKHVILSKSILDVEELPMKCEGNILITELEI